MQDTFRRHTELEARTVRVEVRDSRVILHGQVRSWLEWEEVERVAWAAPGISKVENHIKVGIS